MLQIVLELAGADRVGGVDPADAIAAQLSQLAAWNVRVLESRARAGRPLPPLYASGVRYRRERGERWMDAARVAAVGHGDCEDLASWRAAELRLAGDAHASPVFTVRHLPGGRRLFHVIVRRGDGTTEDPSRLLGMGRE